MKTLILITLLLLSYSAFSSEKAKLEKLIEKAKGIKKTLIERNSFNEGVQKRLTPELAEKFKNWSTDTFSNLTNRVNDIKHTASLEGKIEELRVSFEDAIVSSANNNELLMVYVLKRAIDTLETYENETKEITSDQSRGVLDTKLRILEQAYSYIKNNNKLKSYDELLIKSHTQKSNNKYSAAYFADFGHSYSNYHYELTKSIFDASAQYNLILNNLGYLMWDLVRDENNPRYAETIVYLHGKIEFFKAKTNMTDSKYVHSIRSLKSIYQNVISNLSSTDPQSITTSNKQNEINQNSDSGLSDSDFLEWIDYYDIKKGSSVFPSNWTNGDLSHTSTVVTIDYKAQNIIIKNDKNKYKTKIKDLTFPKPGVCINGICQGETIYPDKFYHTRKQYVIAVNYSTKKILLYDSEKNKYQTYSYSELYD